MTATALASVFGCAWHRYAANCPIMGALRRQRAAARPDQATKVSCLPRRSCKRIPGSRRDRATRYCRTVALLRYVAEIERTSKQSPTGHRQMTAPGCAGHTSCTTMLVMRSKSSRWPHIYFLSRRQKGSTNAKIGDSLLHGSRPADWRNTLRVIRAGHALGFHSHSGCSRSKRLGICGVPARPAMLPYLTPLCAARCLCACPARVVAIF
jgi:hypothetical protein